MCPSKVIANDFYRLEEVVVARSTAVHEPRQVRNFPQRSFQLADSRCQLIPLFAEPAVVVAVILQQTRNQIVQILFRQLHAQVCMAFPKLLNSSVELDGVAWL